MNITEEDVGKEVISKEAGRGHIVEYNKELLYPVVVRFNSEKYGKMRYHSNGGYNLRLDNPLDIAFTNRTTSNIPNIGDDVADKNISSYNHPGPMNGPETSSSMNITEKDIGRMVKSVQAGIGYIVSYTAGAMYPVMVNFSKIEYSKVYYTSHGVASVCGNSALDIEFPGLPIIDPVTPNQPEEEMNRDKNHATDPAQYELVSRFYSKLEKLSTIYTLYTRLEEKNWRERYETSKICPKIAAVANKIESKIQHVIKGHKITKNSANGEVFLVCKNCNVEVTE